MGRILANRSSRAHWRRAHSAEQGYVLLTLLLLVAMIALTLAAMLPAIKLQTQRDRELEMINRAFQYKRAIQLYYKRFGRYPANLDALDNTNNIRFLRKRYKDPMNCANGECQDFRILHFGEVKMNFGPGIAGATNLNVTPVNGPNAGGFSASRIDNPVQSPSQAANSQPDANQNNSDSNGQGSSGQSTDSSGQSSDGSGSTQQTFGGMPVVGVVSFSKKTSIREFNHKNKYSEWQFVYDPMVDRGGLVKAPNQTALMVFGNQQGQGNNPNPNNATTGNGPSGRNPGNQTPSPTPNPPSSDSQQQ